MLPGTATPGAFISQPKCTPTGTNVPGTQPIPVCHHGVAVLAVCLLLSCLAVTAAEGSADSAALEGAWVPTSAEFAGAPMPEKVLKAILLTLHKGDYEVTVVGQPGADRGTCELDTASTPKGMKITGVSGPNAGKTYPAIYEIKGDTLRICYDLSGVRRPAEFKTTKGTKLYLVTYARQK